MTGLKTIIAAAAAIFMTVSIAQAQQMPPPFGKPDDVAFGKQLWTALEGVRLVGANSPLATPYEGGTRPHTKTLITLQSMITINGSKGLAIVKKNFAADGKPATHEQVFADPGKYLRVITVMYQREKGYDAKNQDWYYVIYMPNGEIRKAPNGMNLAGKIADGMTLEQMPANCIACHKTADGNDFVFLHNAVPKR